MNTAKLLVQEYEWYPMPASVHKVLIHGSIIIAASVLPIGQLSEEAQESRNKNCKWYRIYRSRKSSRVATNQDIINMLLLSSDPLISSLTRSPSAKTKSISPEVLRLLQESANESGNEEDKQSETEDSDGDGSSENEEEIMDSTDC